MSLEPNFTPPEQATSIEETKKRNTLITWFKDIIDDSIVGMIVSGSMGYGYDYSVKEASDIDMQLIVTPETVGGLKATGLFNEEELTIALSGYLQGVFGQFSIVFEKDGVNMECHFWDLSAFVEAITYRASETRRLRSGIDTPSTDHGFSFDRKESIKDYYGEMNGKYPVGTFPSYREEGGVLYLCRPITNIVGLPRIEKTNQELNEALNITWRETIKRLSIRSEDSVLNLDTFNIENTLPGKSKMRRDVLDKVRQRTIEELNSHDIAYKNSSTAELS